MVESIKQIHHIMSAIFILNQKDTSHNERNSYINIQPFQLDILLLHIFF